MTETIFEITKAATFDAAHRLADSDDDRYGRLHGHSFRVEASLRGAARARGWVEDLGALKASLDAIASELDHSLLNDHPGLETPTLESLCLHFARRLKPTTPLLCKVTVSRPLAGESCSLACQD